MKPNYRAYWRLIYYSICGRRRMEVKKRITLFLPFRAKFSTQRRAEYDDVRRRLHVYLQLHAGWFWQQCDSLEFAYKHCIVAAWPLRCLIYNANAMYPKHCTATKHALQTGYYMHYNVYYGRSHTCTWPTFPDDL